MSAEEMRKFLMQFVRRHEDDVAQEGRWRAKMMKRLTSQLEAVELKIERRFDKLDSRLVNSNVLEQLPAAPSAGERLADARRRSSLSSAYHGGFLQEQLNPLAAFQRELMRESILQDGSGLPSPIGEPPTGDDTSFSSSPSFGRRASAGGEAAPVAVGGAARVLPGRRLSATQASAGAAVASGGLDSLFRMFTVRDPAVAGPPLDVRRRTSAAQAASSLAA